MQAMGCSHQSDRYKAVGWFLVLLLLSQVCSVVVAAKKNVEHSLPVDTTASCEYGAFLVRTRFELSAEQQRAVENLFTHS